MNKRQRKKFQKKFYYKKYRVITDSQVVYNEETESVDIILYTFHNGSYKLIKAYAYTNTWPSSASNITSSKEEEIEINFLSF